MGMYLSYKEADSASIERMIARCGEESQRKIRRWSWQDYVYRRMNRPFTGLFF